MLSSTHKTYLQGGLDLKSKRLQGLDIYIVKSYYAVTKKGILRNIEKAKNYQHMRINRHGKHVPDNRPVRKRSHENSKTKALSVCQFILDNFETLQRNKRSFYCKTWSRKNPDKVNTKSKVTGKKRKLRVPKWLTKEQMAYMDAVHMEAKALRKGGLKVHVDHIMPLCGDNISGLHVPENLEIVPELDNLLKNNQWEVS